MANEERNEQPRLAIKRLRARNYKSIRELDLELGPLTVLVGPNASGKSNVVDALRFMAHALEWNLDSAITSREGIGAVRRLKPRGSPHDVEVGFNAEQGDFHLDYGFVIASQRGGSYRVKRERCAASSDGAARKFEFDRESDRIIEPDQLEYYEDLIEPTELASESLVRHLALRHSRRSQQDTRASRAARKLRSKTASFYLRASNTMASISGLRTYRISPDALREPRRPEEPDQLREDGRNLASVLRQIKGSRDMEEVKWAMSRVAPGLSDVQIQQSGGYLIVKLKRQDENGAAGPTLDLSQESDGTVRMLGLLTALYQEDPPPLIAIEEPELYVHPGALPVLADCLFEVSHRTQVLVTTHSPDLIDLIDRLSVDCLRAVALEDGCTRVGPVSERQAESVKDGLFTAGELHSMEGLEPRR